VPGTKPPGPVRAEHRRAGDGCQRPLLRRSHCQPRLTPSVRLPLSKSYVESGLLRVDGLSYDVAGTDIGLSHGVAMEQNPQSAKQNSQ
jgi:hypothetical protein